MGLRYYAVLCRTPLACLYGAVAPISNHYSHVYEHRAAYGKIQKVHCIVEQCTTTRPNYASKLYYQALRQTTRPGTKLLTAIPEITYNCGHRIRSPQPPCHVQPLRLPVQSFTKANNTLGRYTGYAFGPLHTCLCGRPPCEGIDSPGRSHLPVADFTPRLIVGPSPVPGSLAARVAQ